MEITAIIISLLSLVVSVICAVSAHNASERAAGLATQNTGLAHATLDLEMRQAINVEQGNINNISMAMLPLLAKKNDPDQKLTPTEETTLEGHEKSLTAATQGYLNVYDSLCAQYLDGRINKERFKKNLALEIRNLIERDTLKEHFDPITSSYKAILKVYKEWYDLEG
ncbi:MAG: hypothetical protein PF795_14210 [Kiritimatiellae bacterium]|jgi:hypothetical protein|nr:hypothetical protein [Kiritimatiellia bacterium]